MAFDTYMQITAAGKTIDGEATAKGYEKWFEILSFSFGASAPVTIGAGSTGISGGRVSVSSFNVMKKAEKASPLIFNACSTGTHLDKIEINMRKATGSGGQQVFTKYIFTECMVESIQWSGSAGGDDTPVESISFAFAKIDYQYMEQGKDGTLKPASQATWDQTTVAT